MHILYGTPLPPGLVAPTKGELRLRVEQLILDDDVINHNPLVQLFDTSEAGSSARAAATTDTNSTAARSPNRFVVPIDHCAVGPIFWGETRPSAHGQPSTPQLRRGPLIMAYPIKMDAEQFGAYLARMTASPQRGVQVDVFVPSSYSGRPPVTVGRCRVALDQLHPGHAVHGWFPVVHRRTRLSSEDAGPYRLAEVPIGKVKLTASVEFYPSTQRTVAEPATTAAAAALEKKHKRHLEGKDGDRAPLPQAKTRRSHRHPGRTDQDAAHPPTETSSSSTAARSASSSTTPTHAEAEQVQLRGGHRLRGAVRGTELVRDTAANTQQLLKLGLQLRAQMQAAARGLAFDDDSGAHHGPPDGRTHAAAAADGADVLDDGEGGLAHEEDGSDASYTSEESDGEKFALQMQKDTDARDQRRQGPPRASPASTPARPLLAESSALKESESPQQHSERRLHGGGVGGVTATAAHRSRSDASDARGRRATVELSFSNFSFAQTALTADLQKMRISVRLSSDIATLEPTSGPLSSFVHPVPVLQPSICLLFDVCSFSEDRSKLVVEAYKVMNEVEVESEEGGWAAQGPRQVVREELLGLSVVGLYRQSRAVVFRDPVLDTTNVFAQLDVHVDSHGADMDTVSAVKPLDASRSPTDGHPQVTLSRGVQGDDSGTSVDVAAAGAAQRSSSKSVATQADARSAIATAQQAESSSIGDPLRVAPAPELRTARCRLRVVVHSAAELPRVAVAEASRRHVAGSSFPIVSARPRSLPEAGVNGATSYAEPNSFVTIEDVYRVAVDACGVASPLTAPPASLRAAQREAVHGWYVDEARGGFFDRSAVAEACSSPEYGYAATLQLPELELPPRTARAGGGSGSPNAAHGVADVLEELQLGLWHADVNRRGASLNGSTMTAAAATAASTPGGPRGGRGHRQEEAFWAAAAYMGTCRVDLRPLRYLKLLDGYYRVVCERTPGSVMGPSSAEAEASTIGYVRLSVSLL